MASVAFLVNTSSLGVGADERRDVGAALLVGVGGLLHQLVRTAVHRAVGRGQKLAFGVERPAPGRCDVAPESR